MQMQPAPPGPEGGGEVDWITALPDDLLRLVLTRLKCAREAARTSVLARRWRGHWTFLPEYIFSGIDDPEAVEAALAAVESAMEQGTRPALDSLRIWVSLTPESSVYRASSLLRAAARLLPVAADIYFSEPVEYNPVEEEEEAFIELPCFDRTRTLKVKGVPLAPTPAGEFSMLEVLELSTDANILADLLPRCPRLRVLRILAHRQLWEVTVHSTTLEELKVGHNTSRLYPPPSTHQIDIDAPQLKKLLLDVKMARDFSLTFSTPKVEELVWEFSCFGNVGLGDYRLIFLNYYLKEGVRTLDLAEINYWPLQGENFDVPDRSFAEEVARLGVSDFSVLKLYVLRNGHAFGPLMLDLLQIRPAIQVFNVHIDKGEVEVDEEEEELCPQDCPCRQPIDWKNETIALFDLEDAFLSCDILEDGEEELDLLKLLFRSAPGIKSMSVRVRFNSDIQVEVRDKVFKKIRRIFKEHPRVKCEVRCS